MTKRDYELLAQIIIKARVRMERAGRQNPRNTINVFAIELAQLYSEEYPNFDAGKFLKRIGIDVKELKTLL
jgi:DNA polymerase III sliding clamp (beta) subunit (PCNA family)